MTVLTFNSVVEIEAITKLNFKTNDVLQSERERVRRHAHLLKAAALDSFDGRAVILTVEDQNSIRKLRSRVMATGDNKIMLEQGLSIPVHCIHTIEFI